MIRLKIKNDIDLENLTMIGFKKDYWEDELCYYYDCGDNRTYLIIGEDRIITLFSGLFGDMPTNIFDYQLKIIYDLTMNGYVEAV